MYRVRSFLLSAAMLASLAASAFAAEGATALLPADSLSAIKPSGAAGEFARIANTPVTGQPFKTVLRIEVTKKPERPTDVQISTPIDAATSAGDVLMVSFYMRSAGSGDGTLDVGFRAVPQGPTPPVPPGAPGAPPARGGRGAFPGQPPLTAAAVAGSAWKKITFPFALTRAFNKGEGELFFTFGLQPQTVEIGGVELADYGTTKKVADLPFTKLGYQGSEPTAAWRKAAEARIDRLRKGDLTVVVKDASGKPVGNAEVAIHMRKHAFLWGTAVSGVAFTGGRMPPENLARYKEEIKKNFNFSVMENETKWPQWANEASRPGTIATIDWLRESGLQVRGHNLVWPSWRNTNVKAATDARDNPVALAKVITDHIAGTTAALRGRLVDWDVINETFTNHDFMYILGRHAMVDWFQAARAGDPGAKLYINDFNIVEADDQAHQDDFAQTIKYLIDQGAPFDGIGLQSHFPSRVTGIDDLLKRFDRFSAFGKELEITEFDINTQDEATQADYTRDYLTVAFSEPAVKAFLMWGFWEGAHWRPTGAMLRRDWSPKANYDVYRDLVFNKWWTNASGKTSRAGTFVTRGFLGDYDIEVKSKGKTKTAHATLAKDGSRVECVLD
jgi:endo-1,4-beta-xylanase